MSRRLTGVLAVVAICAGLAGCSGNGASTTSPSTTAAKVVCVTTAAPRCTNDRHQNTATTGGFLTNTVWQPPWVAPSLLLTGTLSNGQWHVFGPFVVSGPATAAGTTHVICGSIYDPALHRAVTTGCTPAP